MNEKELSYTTDDGEYGIKVSMAYGWVASGGVVSGKLVEHFAYHDWRLAKILTELIVKANRVQGAKE